MSALEFIANDLIYEHLDIFSTDDDISPLPRLEYFKHLAHLCQNGRLSNTWNWRCFMRCVNEIRMDFDSSAEGGISPMAEFVRTGDEKNILKYALSALSSFRKRVNVVHDGFETPLGTLAAAFHFDCVLLEVLLFVGADPDIPNYLGNTPMHYLAMYKTRAMGLDNYVVFARILLEKKPNLNLQNRSGDTPLHLAVSSGISVFIELLLEHGARIDIENENKKTPLDMAFSIRNSEPETFKIFVKQAIIMSFCKIPMNPEYHAEVQRAEDTLSCFIKACNEEVSTLKNIKLGDSSIKLYSILTSDTNAMAKYLCNESIFEFFRKFDRSEFGIFGNSLCQKFEDGVKRKKAVEQAHSYLRKTFSIIPTVCLDQIISDLSNNDLQNFTYAHTKRKFLW